MPGTNEQETAGNICLIYLSSKTTIDLGGRSTTRSLPSFLPDEHFAGLTLSFFSKVFMSLNLPEVNTRPAQGWYFDFFQRLNYVHSYPVFLGNIGACRDLCRRP